MLTHQTIYLGSYILHSDDSLQHSAQQNTSKYSKRGSDAAFGDLSPRLWGCGSSRHLTFNHWASLTALTSFSFNHALEKGRVILQCATSETERGKKEHSQPLHWRFVPQMFFWETKNKRESKNVHGCYFNLTSGIWNTLCLTPFWLDETGFPQRMRQYRS